MRGAGRSRAKTTDTKCVYLLQSLTDLTKRYVGSTDDLDRRLAQHNAGKTKSLRHRIPFEVIYIEECATRAEGLARERWSKTLHGGKELRRAIAGRGSPAGAGKPGMG